jgi:hypothetical protein
VGWGGEDWRRETIKEKNRRKGTEGKRDGRREREERDGRRGTAVKVERKER